MPCGFESLGLGPLAPARISRKGVNVQHQTFGVEGEVNDLVLYGLNKFEILKVKANALTSKINITIKYEGEIRAEISKYMLQSFVKQRGLTVNLVGDGSVDFSLQGLQVDVYIKYSLGVLSQKINIKDLKVTISLDDCYSDITGLLGGGFVNHKMNEFICEFILIGVNDSKNDITDAIEENVKPAINDFLSQHTLGELIGGGSSEPKPPCVPPQ